MPNEVKLLPCENTDRELWREREDDYYANSIHVTKQGGIGICVGGSVIVKPLAEWHALATRPTIVTDEDVERVVAWRWRWVYPGRQNGWTLRQSPIEPLESNSLHVAREVEPLYSRAALAAMPAIVGGEGR